MVGGRGQRRQSGRERNWVTEARAGDRAQQVDRDTL